MASDARDIVTALANQIDNVSGLTVVIGEPATVESMPSPPWCYLVVDEIVSTDDHALGDFNRAMQITAIAAGSATDLDAGEKTLRALDLLDDIIAAIEADVTLGGRAISTIVSGRAFVGQTLGGAELPGVEAQIGVSWYAPRGQGV